MQAILRPQENPLKLGMYSVILRDASKERESLLGSRDAEGVTFMLLVAS